MRDIRRCGLCVVISGDEHRDGQDEVGDDGEEPCGDEAAHMQHF